MPTTIVHSGTRHTVAVWGTDNDSAYGDYLAGLRATGNPDAARVANAIRMLAEAGPPRQKEKGHALEGAECDKLYELKPGGVRVVWFYGAGNTLIVTHVFSKKGAKVSQECKRASLVMVAYWKEISNARA